MTNYTKKAIHSTVILFIVILIASFVAYLFRIFLARNFTVSEFGSIYSIMAFFGLFAIIQDFGLSTALAKYISEFKAKKQLKRIKTIILSSFVFLLCSTTIFGIIFIIFSDFLANNFFHNPSLAIYIKVYSISIMLSPSLTIFKAIFQGYQNMFYFSLVDLLQTSFILIFTLIFLSFNLGLMAPFLSYIVMYIISILFYIIFIKKIFPSFWKIKCNFEKSIHIELIKFSLAVIFTSVAGIIFNYTDSAMITYFRTLNEVGLYNASYPTAKILWMLSGALTLILLPLSSELWAKKDIFRLKEGIKLLYKYSFILIIPISLVFFVFPEFILSFLFGLSYIEASNVLRLLSIGTIFYVIFQINNSILIGIGKPEQVSKVMLFAAFLNLVGNFFLIPKCGIIGATTATIISFVLITVLSFFRLNRFIKFGFVAKEFLLILSNSLLFLIIITLIKTYLQANIWVVLITSLGLGSIIYFISLFLFKIIDFHEIKTILGRLK